jgi:hypothetical protein
MGNPEKRHGTGPAQQSGSADGQLTMAALHWYHKDVKPQIKARQ